jgi:hypothetical protein
MKMEMRAWRKEMKPHWEAMTEACLEKTEVTDLEANPEEIDSSRSIRKSLGKSPRWKLSRALKDRRALPAAKEMNPGRWWVPEEADFIHAVVNCRLCELVLALQLFVVQLCKSSVNPVNTPNSVYSHNHVTIFFLVTSNQHKVVITTFNMHFMGTFL